MVCKKYGRDVVLKIWQALRDLVPSVQFEKREKHPWDSVTFHEVAGWSLQVTLKVTLLHGYFSRFFKLHKWQQISLRITTFTFSSHQYPVEKQLLKTDNKNITLTLFCSNVLYHWHLDHQLWIIYYFSVIFLVHSRYT